MPGSKAELPSAPSLQLRTGARPWGLDAKGWDAGLGSLPNYVATLDKPLKLSGSECPPLKSAWTLRGLGGSHDGASFVRDKAVCVSSGQ